MLSFLKLRLAFISYKHLATLSTAPFRPTPAWDQVRGARLTLGADWLAGTERHHPPSIKIQLWIVFLSWHREHPFHLVSLVEQAFSLVRRTHVAKNEQLSCWRTNPSKPLQ